MTDRTTQKNFLQTAQKELGLTATELASELDTPYNTYKSWLYGVRPMPGVARVAIELFLEKECKNA